MEKDRRGGREKRGKRKQMKASGGSAELERTWAYRPTISVHTVEAASNSLVGTDRGIFSSIWGDLNISILGL